MRALMAVLLFSTLAAGQHVGTPDVSAPQSVPDAPALTDSNAIPVTSPAVRSIPASSPNAEAYTLPAGTRIAVTLKHSISTRNARENDPVYAETSFPVVSNGHVVVPVGTYVQGVIQRSQRPGHLRGRGELLIHFNSLIFPSGYTLLLPGAIDSVPGAEKTQMKENAEGTIENQSNKGKKAVDATTAGVKAGSAGVLIGAVVTHSAGGAATGGLIGAGLGVASVLLSRGPDVRIESGTLVDMVLQREIIVEHSRVGQNDTQSIRIVQ